MTDYQTRIVTVTSATQKEAVLVEGYMRLDWGTLDALSADQFAASARQCLADARANPKAAHDVAASYGLVKP
jgi:hypothetical protein